ncbi:Flavin reductase (NADPH) [Lachnellula suecica]|uniref:Flavin reductase (NADPH) n=1 Tax=Lachnellula suecica TaxID=602035 RepID=A0A8T9CK77_9HELO|nr:Flavin reductase (NADPH) [Lachnellula suecica]
MHLLIIGGSGRTGKFFIEESLQKGHTITALVRKTSSLSPAGGLAIVQGSCLDAKDVETAIESSPTPPSAVVVTLASLRKTESPFSKPVSSPTMMTDTHRVLIAAMKTHGIKKLVTMSVFGVGDSHPFVFFPTRLVLDYSGTSVAIKDHAGLEKLVRSSGLDWTLVRPVMLTDGERNGVKVFGNQGKGVGSVPKVSRASVAGFMVGCLETDRWNGNTPVIAE